MLLDPQIYESYAAIVVCLSVMLIGGWLYLRKVTFCLVDKHCVKINLKTYILEVIRNKNIKDCSLFLSLFFYFICFV